MPPPSSDTRMFKSESARLSSVSSRARSGNKNHSSQPFGAWSRVELRATPKRDASARTHRTLETFSRKTTPFSSSTRKKANVVNMSVVARMNVVKTTRSVVSTKATRRSVAAAAADRKMWCVRRSRTRTRMK